MSEQSKQRRTLIKAGGAVAATTILSQATSYGQGKAGGAGSSEIKVALIGCGGRGTGAANQTLQVEGTKLVAMADAFQDQLDQSFDNLSKMFDKSRLKVKDSTKFIGFGAYKKAIDEADVVILTTPPGFRPQHFEYAIAQGKHVFMEKPVATDVAGIKKVLAAAKTAKEKKLNVVVGLQRHYQKNYQAAFSKIQKGEIVMLNITNTDTTHGIRIPSLGLKGTDSLIFKAEEVGEFDWKCNVYCGEGHMTMGGKIIVE